MRVKIENGELKERLRRGEYVIDAPAVAEAMLRRDTNPFAGLPSLEVLESSELDLPAVSADDDEAFARPHATDPGDAGSCRSGGLCE